MSWWSSVEIEGVPDSPDAKPYLDVAHNSGINEPMVRLIAGFDMDHAAHVELTADQARSVAHSLLQAADLAREGTKE